MIRVIRVFFDRLEDKVRGSLSHRSIIYALIGGVAHVVFWRGVWHTSDILQDKGGFWGWFFYEPVTIVWASIVLLMTGLFVATFIGERIILSGIKREKKVEEKTEEEIEKEEGEIKRLSEKIDSLSRNIEEIKDVLANK